MPQASSLSILPLHPPQARSARVPLTLAQVEQNYAQAAVKPPPEDERLNEVFNGAGAWLDLLERLSADHGTSHFMCRNEFDPLQLSDLMMTLGDKQVNLRLSLNCSIGEAVPSEFSHTDDRGAIVQIQWRISGPIPTFGFFKSFSRAGIWNHLILDGASASQENCRRVASQPNIVHSWEATGVGHRNGGPNPAYGHVHPLPGRPLWQKVTDPAKRFLLADALTRDRLLRLRIDDDGKRLYMLGENLAYHFVPPDQLPDGYLDEICAMVAAGGTVATTHVRANLQRAHLIGYVEEKGIIAGNSSLKNPRPEYIDSVRQQSGLDLGGYVERGYTSVRPEYRGLGIGTRLLEGLTRRAGDRKIFSVIGEDNTATQTIAIRNRTRKVATYFSQKAGKQVGIWMPEWMIDTDERQRP